jgi:hypothetical protein
MQLIQFRDSCTISRNTGHKDEFGNHIKSVVYDGPCSYQEGGQVSFGIITRNPTMYLPSNNVIIEINDSVSVITETGRNIKSLVRVVRDVRLRTMKHLDVTRIELKQATDE